MLTPAPGLMETKTMRNRILYTVSAMILGFAAASAEATEVQPRKVGLGGTYVHPQVDFVSTFGLTKGTELKFGVVVNPVSGRTVTVSPSGQVSGNSTLLGVGGLTSTAVPVSLSTVSRGSVTITGDIATLNKAGTVRLQFPSSLPLNDGGTKCGDAVINPALDGTDQTTTDDDDVLRSAKEVYYGGTLTLTTNETGKHCVGSGQVTLIFDESSVLDPDTFNDPEFVMPDLNPEDPDPDDPDPDDPDPDDPDDPNDPDNPDDPDEPDPGDEPGGDEPGGGWEYPYVNQYLESGEWEALGADIIQQMDNFLLVNNELYTQSQDLYVEKGKDDEHVIISTWEASDQTDFLWRAEYGSASMYGVINAGTGNYQDNGLLLKYDDLDISGYIKISSLGDRSQARTSLLDENAATHITGTTGYLLEIPFERNLYLDTDGLHWAGTDISGRAITESDSVLRLYSGSFEKGGLTLVDEGTYAGLVDKWNH